MTDNSSKRPIADLGVFSRRGAGTLSSAEVIALVLSGLWLLAAVIFFFLVRDSGPQEPDPVRGLLIVLAVAMPCPPLAAGLRWRPYLWPVRRPILA